MTTLSLDADLELRPDPSRVVARLFLPGENTPGGSSRTEGVLARVLALPPADVATEAERIRTRFGPRHANLEVLLRDNAAAVRGGDAEPIGDDVTTVVGAAFTAEFSVEGVSLCNPSAVVHPDQANLVPGALRVLVSVRSIGESHVSSIQFCEAVIGPGRQWAFGTRSAPLEAAHVADGTWGREQFLRALERGGGIDELARGVAQSLPDVFRSGDVEEAVHRLPTPYLHQPHARAHVDWIRVVAGSAYRASFPEGSALSARVLLPTADEERNGLEDARFVRQSPERPGESAVYRGTFTAYDGATIGSRRISTTDFRVFEVERLSGSPADTKGMALFPRQVAGQHVALSRSDGESIGLCRSADGLHWDDGLPLRAGSAAWEIVQGGNCGSPIETSEGWLVLTHGVGPMRVYSIGAILLDRDDPSIVVAVLDGPLVEAVPELSAGYVPNVVYSCGGLVHDGVLWIPYGVSDNRIRVASALLSDVLAAMSWEVPARRPVTS